MRNARKLCITGRLRVLVRNSARVSRLLSLALAVVASLIGPAPRLLLAEELGERFEILLVHAADDAGHDRVLTLAALVVLERVNDVVRRQAGQLRIVRSDRLVAIGAVTSDAGLSRRRRGANDFLA